MLLLEFYFKDLVYRNCILHRGVLDEKLGIRKTISFLKSAFGRKYDRPLNLAKIMNEMQSYFIPQSPII